jgi:hypothetical protein
LYNKGLRSAVTHRCTARPAAQDNKTFPAGQNINFQSQGV